MKNRGVLIALFLGLIVMGFLAAAPSQTVSAQVCFDPQNPNKQIPCPEEDTGDGGRKKKRPTAIPSVTPSPTSTPTETPTPTPTATNSPTPTVMPTPTLVFGVFASAPGQGAGGFSCLPYAGSIPIGAGLLGLGLLTLSSRAGILRSGFSFKRDRSPDGAGHSSEEQASAAAAARKAAEAEAVAPSSIGAIGGMIAAVVLVIIAIIVAVFTFGAGVGRIIIASFGAGSVSTNIGTGTTASSGEGIIEAMMALLKSSLRDMRESIASKKKDLEMELSARKEDLLRDNSSIDEGMAEAQEKADQAMAAANLGMSTGIVAGLVQIAGGLLSPSGQGSGSTASGWVGTAVAGVGAGILGSALFGGLLGFDCISVYVLLPSGAALGMLAAIAFTLLFQNQRNQL